MDASDWPRRNFHTDLDAATKMGLSAPIASGTQLQGHVAELCVRMFGSRWLAEGSMDVRFVRGIAMDQTVTATAIALERRVEGDAVCYTIEIEAVASDGTVGLAGTCTGYVDLVTRSSEAV
jgi:hypothetical protein